MPDFKFTGDQKTVFPSLAASDGSTLVVSPDEVVTLDADPSIESLSAVTQKAAKTVESAPATVASDTPPESPTTPAPSA